MIPTPDNRPPLMRVEVEFGGDRYQTTDTAENIGPWLGRLWSAIGPGPYTPVVVRIF